MDKTCLITGGSAGIGKAIAKELAGSGFRIIIIARNQKMLLFARDEIIQHTGNENVEAFMVDLSLQSNIKEFANLLESHIPKLDILVNNAGVNLPYRKLTGEGIEYMFALNHIAPFLLTNLLLDKLKTAVPSQVINIVSNGEKYAHFDLENLQGEKRFNGMQQYCFSKLCNLMFSYELARRLDHSDITSNAIHPGGVRTNIMKHYKSFSIPSIVWFLLYPSLNKPEEVAAHILSLIVNDAFLKVNGHYFFNGKPFTSSQISYDVLLSSKLWDLSEKLTGLNKMQKL